MYTVMPFTISDFQVMLASVLRLHARLVSGSTRCYESQYVQQVGRLLQVAEVHAALAPP